MLGNGWTADVIAHIFKGIVEQELMTFNTLNSFLDNEQIGEFKPQITDLPKDA
jgi:hypothetical protein